MSSNIGALGKENTFHSPIGNSASANDVLNQHGVESDCLCSELYTFLICTETIMKGSSDKLIMLVCAHPELYDTRLSDVSNVFF